MSKMKVASFFLGHDVCFWICGVIVSYEWQWMNDHLMCNYNVMWYDWTVSWYLVYWPIHETMCSCWDAFACSVSSSISRYEVNYCAATVNSLSWFYIERCTFRATTLHHWYQIHHLVTQYIINSHIWSEQIVECMITAHLHVYNASFYTRPK